MSYKAFAGIKEHVEIEALKKMSYEDINKALNFLSVRVRKLENKPPTLPRITSVDQIEDGERYIVGWKLFYAEKLPRGGFHFSQIYGQAASYNSSEVDRGNVYGPIKLEKS